MTNGFAKKDGFGLIEVLLAAGLAGVLAVVLSTLVTNNNKMTAKIYNDSDITSIKNALTKQISCQRTMFDASGNPICTEGAVIPLKDKKKNIIGDFSVKKDQGYKLAPSWFIKPICRGSGLEVRLAKVGGKNQYWKNPITGVDMDYAARPNPIFAPFPDGIPLCGDGAGGGSSQFSIARAQSQNGGYFDIQLQPGAEIDDFIYNDDAKAEFCANPAFNIWKTCNNSGTDCVCDPADNRVKKLTCNSDKGLSLVSCVGVNSNSSAPVVLLDGNGCYFLRSAVAAVNITCSNGG